MSTTTQVTQPKPAAQAKPSRMTLASIISGKIDAPCRVLLYGVEGVGKSTFGAGAPSPIFLGSEEGTGHLNVKRFPKPESWAEVLEALRTLKEDNHSFETLVVDTLDWIEPLIWREVCARDGKQLIEEVGGGYGKGYTAAVDEWRKLLATLEQLQAAKRMHVVLLAHSHIKSFKNPEGDDFDRYQIKLNERAAGPLKEWADAVLFAKHETLAHKDKQKRVRGVSTGARLIHTERTAAYDAKNRYSLPEELPLSWEDFYAAAKSGRVAGPDALRAEIDRKAQGLAPEIQKAILMALAKAGDNSQSLALINNKVNARLAEKAAAETAAPAAEKVS